MTSTTKASLSGLELLRAGAASIAQRPGIGQLLGMEVEALEEGLVSFAVTTQPAFANPLGDVHGGICATLLDSVMGCAVHTTLEAGVGYSTIEIKVNYTRTISVEGRRLTAIGKTIHTGRRTATAEGEVRDDEGRLVAHGTTTCLIHRSDPPSERT
ncbi:PaaI family thioesterase [Nocardioides sp. KC13]|uniref:PaaI family thioesterase n=1 Tax=Nocardioides turkmenicus TaxID=2711220 RepID=A0A6M1QQ17_9ACTN|nr:PaaI family thioesterase [Nocardioides sp. KC13]NGN91835.1 PaaI family thioesterase [Nocardioides sp. KC13]